MDDQVKKAQVSDTPIIMPVLKQNFADLSFTLSCLQGMKGILYARQLSGTSACPHQSHMPGKDQHLAYALLSGNKTHQDAGICLGT